jgi:hypothetical protein
MIAIQRDLARGPQPFDRWHRLVINIDLNQASRTTFECTGLDSFPAGVPTVTRRL